MKNALYVKLKEKYLEKYFEHEASLSIFYLPIFLMKYSEHINFSNWHPQSCLEDIKVTAA